MNAAYDQGRTGHYEYAKKATAFTSDHGLKGYSAWATVTGVKKTDKCVTDGRSFTVSYTDTAGDFATWVLYTAKGVKDEIPDATVKKIMSTLRPLESASTSEHRARRTASAGRGAVGPPGALKPWAKRLGAEAGARR
ncbi:hypothetical protein NKH77_08800 [Streptomyces sp. M19]